MLAWALAALTLAASPVLEDDGRGCPDAGEVGAELARLGLSGPVRARLAHSGDSVEVLLLGGSGEPIARRDFVVDRPCAALAAAAAVTIAAWSATWATPSVSLPARPPPGARAVWEVGAAGAGSWTPAGATAGGALVASLGGTHWGGGAALLLEGSRGLPLAAGSTAVWEREALALGPEARLPFGRWTVRFAAEGLLSLVAATGQGLSLDRTSTSADPGVGLSARLSVRLGPVRPFAALWGLYWLRQEVAQVSGSGAEAALPQGEILAALGLAFGSDGAPEVRSGAAAP
ncbi:MAG: hypothetical protein ACYDCL_14475 [Myxococcales bacterium]